MSTEVHCHIKNQSLSDLILDGEGVVKGMGFANIGDGKFHWNTKPPAKIPATGGEGYFSATNETLRSYISVGAKYKASIDDVDVSISFGACSSTWPGGAINEDAELSKKYRKCSCASRR